jgi:hypothetical protein
MVESQKVHLCHQIVTFLFITQLVNTFLDKA